jgi:hypothetical protein
VRDGLVYSLLPEPSPLQRIPGGERRCKNNAVCPRLRNGRPGQFTAFDDPGYVKIVWMMRADVDGASRSVARTETRVATTDADARARFRWYWSFLSPGIKLIRLVMLSQTKARAEAELAARG